MVSRIVLHSLQSAASIVFLVLFVYLLNEFIRLASFADVTHPKNYASAQSALGDAVF